MPKTAPERPSQATFCPPRGRHSLLDRERRPVDHDDGKGFRLPGRLVTSERQAKAEPNDEVRPGVSSTATVQSWSSAACF